MGESLFPWHSIKHIVVNSSSSILVNPRVQDCNQGNSQMYCLGPSETSQKPPGTAGAHCGLVLWASLPAPAMLLDAPSFSVLSPHALFNCIAAEHPPPPPPCGKEPLGIGNYRSDTSSSWELKTSLLDWFWILTGSHMEERWTELSSFKSWGPVSDFGPWGYTLRQRTPKTGLVVPLNILRLTWSLRASYHCKCPDVLAGRGWSQSQWGHPIFALLGGYAVLTVSRNTNTRH